MIKMNSNKSNITLRTAKKTELEKFKIDLQEAFRISAEKELCHVLDVPIPSDLDFEESLKYPGAIVYHVILDDTIVGGAIVAIDEKTQYNKLLLFFIKTDFHSQGVGYMAWMSIEDKHPKTKTWETVTPYFEKRNIHFYLNKCGFKIVEYFNKYHSDPNQKSNHDYDEMFKFEKSM
ncbi:GNAT family N-acetyltransferase [Sulfuricurvum sp.]|uniref:GNAT family N-acetyltransferase n=1 Tax=Sulfuricurvum sp. TaxID=2025608 RepID=UPI0026374EDE|nr:GNAT family N-acetyltransferase [Sulfuricurvum sp.]MDD2837936.1 GNAT family N-acetyltransferase [Sulfuricurvum sp.]MDD3596270.1 GNAT family N-acetyltransferase [Sulfuricurvum sp.]